MKAPPRQLNTRALTQAALAGLLKPDAVGREHGQRAGRSPRNAASR